MKKQITLLDQQLSFPSISLAQEEPDGLLAIGGDLSVARLTEAYRSGIFPWYNQDEPILWWSPNPRCVFDLTQEQPVHVSKSLTRKLRKQNYKVRINQNFNQVISNCSMPRATQAETWILPEMQLAYNQLHQHGLAHCVEVYSEQEELVGGLYGVSIGRFFFGESMFSRQNDTSKIALAHLAYYLKQAGFVLIDCQVPNPHLYSLGAVDISRDDFSLLLIEYRDWQQPSSFWQTKELKQWK